MICQDNRKIFPWSVDHRCYGRSTRHPMVGRASTLWSVDQATFEWNGPKTESSVNDFLHKRAKMCNFVFLDCKLKSQKFNYRFDSISWIYVTLWYQKTKRQADVLIYAASYCFTGHGPVPTYLHLCNFEIQLQNYIPCRGAYFLGRISLSGTAYSCFIVISPFVAVRNIPVWAKMDSSRRTGNIPSSWYKRWRWTQFATAIIVSKGTGDRPDICRTLLLFGTRTCPYVPCSSFRRPTRVSVVNGWTCHKEPMTAAPAKP